MSLQTQKIEKLKPKRTSKLELNEEERKDIQREVAMQKKAKKLDPAMEQTVKDTLQKILFNENYQKVEANDRVVWTNPLFVTEYQVNSVEIKQSGIQLLRQLGKQLNKIRSAIPTQMVESFTKQLQD